MADGQRQLFTIGQFAALHGINKKTLMWYDETGLFRPAVVRENGYRCYTYAQSSTLETILMLRELDVPISEIREFLRERSAPGMQGLLEEKLTEVDRQLRRLRKLRAALEQRREEVARLAAEDLTAVTLREQGARALVLVPTSPGLSLEQEIELVIAQTRRHCLDRLHDAVYGSVLPVENLYRGDFDGYQGLFVELPREKRGAGLFRRPPGVYLTAYCQGPWERIALRYRELLEYAAAQGLRLHGYAYETGVNETWINSMEEYITRIEILAETQ